MRWIYAFLMYLLIPFLLLRLWWKGLRLPAYHQGILQRFCWDKVDAQKIDVWVHAVSLGEVIAAIPLIEELLQQRYSVLITTMTPTGAEQVKKRFADKVAHRYVPYDLVDVVRRFFKRVQPRVGIIMETELWPNLIVAASEAKVPLFLANARLSEYSLQGYKRFKFLFKPVLHCFSAILAQSPDDAQRFLTLGAPVENVHALGNIKFDLHTQDVDSSKFQQLKDRWGSARTVLIIASTHEDEESQILAHVTRLQQAIPAVIVLIAPRHPERFQAVYQLCLQNGFNTGLRSDIESLNEANEVVVLDCLGELLGLYQISDYSFVGGSFIPVGGHNVLEPIAMGLPVFSGPHVHNFKTICADLTAAQAIVIVSKAEELIDSIIQLHRDPEARQVMIRNATAVLEANKGAVKRHLDTIQTYLSLQAR